MNAARSLRLALATTLVLLGVGAAGAADETLEYPVKAAFLAKFGGFVEWPAGAFATPGSPLQLCVLGEGPVAAAIDRAIGGQQAGSRAIELRRLKAPRAEAGCHVLYIAASEAPRQAQVLEGVRGTPVLTVTDTKPGSGPVGIINFVVRDERVRFDIDDEAAAQNKLAISSKLLAIALSVKPRR
jgi:hypothetical protein